MLDWVAKIAKWGGLGCLLLLASGQSLPSLPGWTSIVTTGLLAGAIVALVGAGKIEDLLPDPEPDVIVREVAADRTDVGVYGFSDDAFDNVVIHGKLRPLPDARGEQYEAYRVHPDPSWTDNPGVESDPPAVLTGTFLGQEPDAKLVGHYSGRDARREISQIKDDYEDLAAAGRILIEHFPSVLRRLDRDRAVRWVQRLGGDVAGDVGERSDVDEAIKNTLPMQLIPAQMFTTDELQTIDEDTDDDDGLDDVDGPTPGEAIDTILDADPDALGGDSAVATDGGDPDA